MGLFGRNEGTGRSNYPASGMQVQGTNALRGVIQAGYVSGDADSENRLVRYHLGWKFYRNKHWNKDNDKLLSFNYVRAFIDKVNDFLAGKEGFTTNVYDLYGREVPEELERSMEALVEYIWRYNRKGVRVQEMLQMGGVCGDVFIFLDIKKEIESVKLTVLDSRMVLPVFENGDRNNLVAYMIVEPMAYNEDKFVQKVREYRLVQGKTQELTYFKKGTERDAPRFREKTVETDLPFLPIVHIKNHPSSDEWSGTPDTQDILKLNKIYNECAEDVRTIIAYYATPTTVITGAVVGDLKRGANNIWSGLPSEAQVFNLGLGEDLSASMNFLKMLKDAMHDFSGVPENTLGKLQAVSNTSGAALHIMYQPLIEAANKKWLSYAAGVEEVNKRALWIMQNVFPAHELVKEVTLHNGSKPLDTNRFFATPVFTYALPVDRALQLSEAQIELQTHIASRKEIMTRLGKRNIPIIETQITADREADNKFAADLAKASTPPEPPTPKKE